ncbi:MAG: hypothetical protein JNJ72_19270 [Anaerolineales bacterium]|nr:hypothetical protein [Anaerolineales bacterium]
MLFPKLIPKVSNDPGLCLIQQEQCQYRRNSFRLTEANYSTDDYYHYTYDSANRLTSFNGTSSHAYIIPVGDNELGDRLSQNGVNYTLDLNSGLTQVLSDGTNTYIYGLGRIAQVNITTEYLVSTGSTYHLGDALGFVKQLTDASGEVTLANAYDPYGVLAQ